MSSASCRSVPASCLVGKRAELIPPQQTYTFQDLGQLRTLRALREEDVPAASIRDSIVAMRAVAGMTNPLLEASLVRYRHSPGISLQRRHGRPHSPPTALRFRASGSWPDPGWTGALRKPGSASGANEHPEPLPRRRAGRRVGREEPRHRPLRADRRPRPRLRPCLHQPGHHLLPSAPLWPSRRTLSPLPPRPTRATCLPSSIWATSSTSWNAPKNRSVPISRPSSCRPATPTPTTISPSPTNAKAEERAALRHWQAYLRLDRTGPWADHARSQIRKLLDGEQLSIAWRADRFVPGSKSRLHSNSCIQPAKQFLSHCIPEPGDPSRRDLQGAATLR